MLDRVLGLDSAQSPNHVGAMLILNSNAAHLRTVESRLRARATADRGSPDLQVERHRLPFPGSRSQLFRLVESLHVGPLRRGLPPWEAHFIDGLPTALSALYVKAHHSTTDGLGGLHELLEVLDLQVGSSPSVTPLSGAKSLSASLSLLIASCIRPLVRPAPRLPFNRPVGPARRIIALDFPVDVLQRLARSTGSTVNDVLLSAVAEGLHRDAVLYRETTSGQFARVFVPVSVRRPTDPPMGNLVAAVAVEMPLASSSLRDRIELTRRRTKRARTRVSEAGVNAAICTTALPLALLCGVASRIGVKRQWMYNLTVSNLGSTGTQKDQGDLGLLEFYPLTSLALDLAISVCVITHSSNLYVSLIGDARVSGDLEVIAAGIRDCLSDSIGP
jgi:diacylglycerol O-acyltransferase